MLQEVEVAQTVSVFVLSSLNTVVTGFWHRIVYLGSIVAVKSSQQEQSLLYVVVCAAFVYVQRGDLCSVIVFVQATKPGPMPADPETIGSGGGGVVTGVGVAYPDGEQLVTVVRPGAIGLGVGQIIMH